MQHRAQLRFGAACAWVVFRQLGEPCMASSIPLKTSSLGFPRVGSNRELKFALESFWKGKTTENELLNVAKSLRRDHWLLQKEAGISVIPSNDFSLYDQVLDTLVMIVADQRFSVNYSFRTTTTISP
jgi:hypothetical protein